MRERPEQIAKIVCLALGTLLFFRFVWIIVTANPLARVVVPALPSLPDESPSNAVPATVNMMERGGQGQGATKTNLPAAMTNSPERLPVVAKQPGSSAHPLPVQAGTNTGAPGGLSEANIGPGQSHRKRHGQLTGAMGFPGRKVTVAPAIQASIDRITDSEILGPVIRPLPMALLGIAGEVAFLRTPDGVTGLLKEGDELGGIKLLRIGVNRVLIEENGQRKELTIFDGIGGKTLLDKSLQSSNENDNP
jgi:hypothetical protein